MAAKTALTIAGGAVGGALAGRVLDEAVAYKANFKLGGKDITIHPSVIVGLGIIGAQLAGVKLPAPELLSSMAAGMIASDAWAQYGDDVAMAVLGPPTGAAAPAPAPVQGLPAPGQLPAAFAPYGYGYPNPYSDAALQASMNQLGAVG